MARKIKDDDDMDAGPSAAAEIEAELAQAKGKRVTETTAADDVEVDLDAEDDDEDDAPPARDASEQRSRNERRRDRYREQKEATEASERRAAAAEERERQATLRADAMALSFRQQLTPQADPLEKELEQARADKQALFDEMTNLPVEVGMEPKRYAAYTAKVHAADERIMSIIARKNAPPQQQGPSEGRMLANVQFPDVMAHPEGSRRTDALFTYKVACGAPQSQATLIAALTEVRAELRTGPQRRDVAGLKGKLGHSSAGRGTGAGEAPRRVVKLDANMRKLAKAAYRGQGLSEDQMYAKFARENMADD